MSPFKTETIFITGASSGFGEACARRLHKNGAKVILTARRKDRLIAIASELQSRVHVVELDVRNRLDVEQTIKNLPKEFSEITALVNNAGLALGLENAPNASLDDWDTMIDTNCKGLTYCTRAVLPEMVKQNRGYIFNIGSIAGTYPYPGGNVYGGTKAFVRQFSLNLRAELLGTKIRVTNIEPGMAETEFSEVRFRGDKDKARKVYEGMAPLTGEDIAESVCWCLSLPKHVNVNILELMPVAQASGALAVRRS